MNLNKRKFIMKKAILTSILLFCTSLVLAESVETTAVFRNMMKREYNIVVPKTLVADAKAAEICYGLDVAPCNKLYRMCEKSRSQGCRAYTRKLEAIAAKEYVQ